MIDSTFKRRERKAAKVITHYTIHLRDFFIHVRLSTPRHGPFAFGICITSLCRAFMIYGGKTRFQRVRETFRDSSTQHPKLRFFSSTKNDE